MQGRGEKGTRRLTRIDFMLCLKKDHSLSGPRLGSALRHGSHGINRGTPQLPHELRARILSLIQDVLFWACAFGLLLAYCCTN